MYNKIVLHINSMNGLLTYLNTAWTTSSFVAYNININIMRMM